MTLTHWGYLETELTHKIKQKPRHHGSPPPPNRGETNPRAKLTESQVREIYQIMVRDKNAAPRLARHYGVNNATIRAIGYGVTWRHITSRR